MSKTKKQSFQRGALILSLAALTSKLIGALFKIPLQREELAGLTGFGYFSTAYDIYTPIYTIAIAGLPVAVSRMVAESISLKRYREVGVIYRVARRLFFVTGTLGSLAMLIAAFVYPNFVGIPNSFWSMLVMAPTVLFCCLVSAHRGLYEGTRNMAPTAVSQVIESLGKLVLGLGLAWAALALGMGQYDKGLPVYGTVVETAAQARERCLPFVAAGAMLGVTIGSFLALVYMVIRHHRVGSGITREELAASPPPRSRRRIFRSLLKIAVPVALGALATELTNLVDVVSLQRCLKAVLEQNGDAVRAMYSEWLQQSGTTDVLSWLIGGRGTALTYVSLVPNVTLTFGISAIPVITAACALKDAPRLKRTIESVIRLTVLISFPAGIGMAVLSGPILYLVYGQEYVAGMVGPLLTILGASVPFICLTAPINSILQALGRADIPVKIVLVGGVVKLVFNLLLIRVPSLNIQGSAISTLICYIVMVILSLRALRKVTGLRLSPKRTFLKPLFASICCGAAAWSANGLLSRIISPRVATILAIILAGIIYLFALFLCRALTKEDVYSLPKGQKIAQLLEKHGWIG